MNKYLATQKSWLIWKNYITTAVCWENMNQKMQKGPGARYKNAVPTTIRTGCPAKWYAKKPKSMPNHWLVGVIPKHNHKIF